MKLYKKNPPNWERGVRDGERWSNLYTVLGTIYVEEDIECGQSSFRWKYCIDEYYDEGQHECESMEDGERAAEEFVDKRLEGTHSEATPDDIREAFAEQCGDEDDDEPVTVDWAESIGASVGESRQIAAFEIQCLKRFLDVLVEDGRPVQLLIVDEEDKHQEWFMLWECKTRGQVRRLLDALGIKRVLGRAKE